MIVIDCEGGCDWDLISGECVKLSEGYILQYTILCYIISYYTMLLGKDCNNKPATVFPTDYQVG